MKYFYILILSLSFAAVVYAAEPAQPVNKLQQAKENKIALAQEFSVELDKEYFAGYWTDTKDILTAPARWKSSDWVEASIVTGLAVGLFTQDDHIHSWVQKHKNATTAHLSDNAKMIGIYSIPAVIGLGAYGYIADDGKSREAVLLSAESFIITGAFVQVLKHSTGRHRPYTGSTYNTWSGPIISGYHDDHLSFPSGDASSAFSVASVIASEYDNMVVPPLVYTGSLLIALSRVHNNVHWSSDVFVGSAIGYFVGKAVFASHRLGKKNNLSIVPLIEGKDVGFLMNYRY